VFYSQSTRALTFLLVLFIDNPQFLTDFLHWHHFVLMLFQIMLVSSVRDSKQLRNYTTGVKAIWNGLSAPGPILVFFKQKSHHFPSCWKERTYRNWFGISYICLDLEYLHNFRSK